jgi:DeoR/GlpR family transcriptional regulator of sugar metabolism
LTVITNNNAVIERLKDEPGIILIALGGVYSAKFNAFLGVVTEESLSRLRADVAFLSTPAVMGLQTFHMDDAVVRAKRSMMAAAGRTCLLVNHTRFQRSAPHVLAQLSDFDCIITDAEPTAEVARELVEAGITLTVARDAP